VLLCAALQGSWQYMTRNARFWQAGARAVTRRRALGAGLGVAGASALAMACGGTGSDTSKDVRPEVTTVAQQQSSGGGDQPRQGGHMRLRLTGTPPLDPFANTTFRAQTMAGYTYSRLVRFKTGLDPAVASNYEIAPDLAAAWEMSGDGTQLTFKLQPNATFHAKAPVNGRAVDAEDVKFSFERFKAEPKNSNRAAFGTPENPLVEKLETPDPKTVVVKLAKPYGPILNLFANPQYLWILPKESAGGFDPAKDQIGSGPWVLESLQPDQEVKLKANRRYFQEGRPYLDNWTIAIIGETVQGKAQFQAERLDLEAITFEDKNDVVTSNPKAKLVTYTPTTTPFIGFQLRGNSPFKDERVRRAFSMAFDRDALLQLSYEGQGWYHNAVPANFGKWWLDPKSTDAGESGRFYKHNPREAKQLIQAAGASGMQFKFIYTNNAYGERFNQWAETLAIMLKDIGVSPTIVVQDYAREYIVANGTFFGGFDGIFFGLQTPFTDPHDFLFNMAHSQSKRNHAGVADLVLDSMIDKEGATLDENARVKQVREIQKYMSERMYYAMGFVGPAYTAVQP
jgi:peptide/nickel transport system substrate-binding protein